MHTNKVREEHDLSGQPRDIVHLFHYPFIEDCFGDCMDLAGRK